MKARHVAKDGEWIQPKRRNFQLECCDCHLVHKINFRLVKTLNGGHSIQFQAFRDNRRTAQARKTRPNK